MGLSPFASASHWVQAAPQSGVTPGEATHLSQGEFPARMGGPSSTPICRRDDVLPFPCRQHTTLSLGPAKGRKIRLPTLQSLMLLHFQATPGDGSISSLISRARRLRPRESNLLSVPSQ